MKNYDDSKRAYEESINELPVPDDDRKSNGGRIPDNAEYGTWLRRNDPIAFQVGYQEWARELQFLAERKDSKATR